MKRNIFDPVFVIEVRDLDLLGVTDAQSGDCCGNKKLKANNILCS